MDHNISGFFEQWVDEFTRAVEMFTGEQPTILRRPADEAKRAEWNQQLASYNWWRQNVEGDSSFGVWVGSQEACSTPLGGALGEGDPMQMFREMLGQANSGTTAVLSSSFPKPLRCSEGAEETPESLLSLEAVEVVVTYQGTALPGIIVAVEPSAAKVLSPPVDPPKAIESRSSKGSSSNLPVPSNAPMIERFMDLQLPVSVLLGEASLPIRDVIKISSGSLIELDRHVGDYVEVIVHGTVVARGEIVSVKGNYGVRIREVISRHDRLALRDAA